MASSLNGRKPSEIFKAQALLYKHIFAFIDSMSLKWAVEMNIPNIIHNHGKPISLSNLVSILQVPSSKIGNVRRLMRYLAHNGFFEIITKEEESYALTVASELLVRGSDLCLAPMVEPQVVENLSGSNNLTYVGGDMFTSIPNADAVLLKYILHNWTDKDCTRILKKCKEAVTNDGKKGKVIIIDMVINEKKDENQVTQIKLLMDVNMACLNGKERNEEEWKKLFIEAGFQDYKISPLTGFLSLIEIYP
ncbi:Isoflavone 7-O-methyltransferase [Medicago truncatula]|uniref:Isoflavone 7-O-methyltransferase n=1 Tax=Medicago truncatula TaxID=3880 RepID=A0A396GTG4_MEDTR|nr:Isoflavone 7-O-methyltransferase [Medicago truncatula]